MIHFMLYIFYHNKKIRKKKKTSQRRVCLVPVLTLSDLWDVPSLISSLHLLPHLRSGLRARS